MRHGICHTRLALSHSGLQHSCDTNDVMLQIFISHNQPHVAKFLPNWKVKKPDHMYTAYRL